jgi:RNA polymerase sigma factor (sigma-70 family)
MSKSRKQLQTERLTAFEEVVKHYEAALLRYVSRLVNNSDITQDIVQNTFIRLFRKWQDEMVVSANISSWLYRVAHNCAIDYMRKETRRRELHEKHAKERPTFAPPDRGQGFRITEAAAQASEALQTLSERERQLVVLKVYEEKSYKEISEIADLSVSNVGYILHHAMKKMATHLKSAKAI